MNTTHLRLRAAPGWHVDAAGLLPADLAGRALGEIEHMLLPGDAQPLPLGELFDVTRSAAAGRDGAPALVIDANADAGAGWLDRLGWQLASGELSLSGAAGDYAGHRMSGGTLFIGGDAGRFTGCEMSGGRLTVGGNSGDFAAAALPGNMEGMSGGVLTIQGHAGARLADRMRRGLVLVGGDAGEFAAARIVAGTVGIAGRVGQHYAYGMRRGSLLLMQAPERLPPTFGDSGTGFDVFWSLLTRSLARELAPFAALAATAATLPRRYTGDIAVGGRGEILVASTDCNH